MGFLVVFLVQRNCVGKFVCSYVYFLLHHKSKEVLIPFPSQKGELFFVIAWNMLSSLLAHHRTHLPTLSFPKIYYTKCWNERIHNCRECLTNMATCHWTTRAPCMRFIIAGSVSLTWQHFIWTTRAPCMRFIIAGSVSLTWRTCHLDNNSSLHLSAVCVTFSYLPNSFLHILGLWLVKSHNSLFLCPIICNLGTSTQSIIFYNHSIMG
jgi:hypothetical protein